MSLSRLTRPLGLALSGLLVATAFALAPSSPALAAVKAPTGLAPKGAVSSSTPTFTWSRVAGATSYQLVVTQDSTSTTLIQQGTANNRFVPKTNLPDGALSWQVRAVGASGNGPWASASTTISPTAPPSLTSPGDGAHLSQPDEPPLFKWSPVAGAVGYEVQVDNTGTWVNPTSYQTKGNSYFVDNPQAPGTWHWRVRADRGNGLLTQWSSPSTYIIDALPDPQAAADMNTGTPQQDVRVHWQAVDGATAYQLQVGRDPDFNNIVDDVTVYSTLFTPPVTYDNDQYYWRVRAMDAGQNRMPWTVAVPFVFQRQWLDKPTLQFPADQLAPAIGDSMYYQWTPVKHATRYQVDASTDPNFSPATIRSCFTSATSLSPFDLSPTDNRLCGPQGQGVTTYWRVRAIDDPRGVVGIFSGIRKYIYDSGAVALTSPANGATVDVPTLKWDPVRETHIYNVLIKDHTGAVAASVQTHSTSWTPEGGQLPTSGNPYSWTVQAVKAVGLTSPLYSGRTFSVTGNMPTSDQPALSPLTGVVGDPATDDFPDLTWVPMPGAASYRLQIGVSGSQFWDNVDTSHINGTAYAYPAATDIDLHYLSPGQYIWQVQAYNDTGGLIGTSPVVGNFTIKQLSDVTGQGIALDARAAVAGQTCNNKLSAVLVDDQICKGVPVTPVLKWNPVPYAAGYLVYLANDQELTNPVVAPYAAVTSNMWRPPSDLPDNTAQDSYYWYVRPCKVMSPLVGCTADPASTDAAATNAFRKQSPPVQLRRRPTAPRSPPTRPSRGPTT